MVGVQVISVKSDSAGVDAGELSDNEVAKLFGTTSGFKASSPNVTPAEDVPDDDDF